MSKLLVTGASGFIGNALCKKLLSENNEIVAPCRSSEKLPKHELLDFKPISGLENVADWSTMLADVEVVVHLASRVHVMKDSSDDALSDYRKINVVATVDLAKQAAKAGVKRFVYISSIKVNGEQSLPGKPFNADDQPAPTDPYAISKYEAEEELKRIAASTGLELVIIRPPLVYGPGVKANFLIMMEKIERGSILPFGAIKNLRSLVALDNLVDFIVVCIKHKNAANETFLISDDEDLSTSDLLKRLASAMNVNARVWSVPEWIIKFGAGMLGQSAVASRLCGFLQADITKNRELLGWTPPYVDDSFKSAADDFVSNKKINTNT